jgi:iron complex transport system ATP-binding protein
MMKTVGLTLHQGKAVVLQDATLAIQPGQVTAIIGPNGAGKTSLIKALAGLITPVSGSIEIDGQPLPSLSDRERALTIGYLPQEGSPAWAVTVDDLVSLGRLPHTSSPVENRAAIEAAIAATDISHLTNRTVDTLSGGELARAKIARVLAGKPRWILADEPLANLDPPHQRDTLTLLRTIAQQGVGVVTILHQLNAAMDYADAVIMLKSGRVVAQGSTRDTLTAETLAAVFGMAFDVFDHNGRSVVVGQA